MTAPAAATPATADRGCPESTSSDGPAPEATSSDGPAPEATAAKSAVEAAAATVEAASAKSAPRRRFGRRHQPDRRHRHCRQQRQTCFPQHDPSSVKGIAPGQYDSRRENLFKPQRKLMAP
jgi:hypothetical protein